MANQALSGKTALVTGASSGLGVDFARELASLGCAQLVLVARREELLKKLQAELEQRGVKVSIVTLDLAAAGAPQALHDLLRQQGLAVDVLVNNAGFGLFGKELEIPWDRTQQMLQLNMLALTQLSKLFAHDMLKRGFGYIMQIASTGAYQPTPTYAAYAATKAYVLSYGEALNFELRGTGVSCTVISPGVTATEFLRVSGQKATWYQRMTSMSSAEVARAGVRKMLARRGSAVIGWINWLAAFSVRFTPRAAAAATGYQLMKND
jgi:short-subunit dehydrogenase